MSGGDSGGGSNTSRPLTAAERSELFDASMSKLGGYMPSTSDYQGYTIVDPSADRGRGVQSNGLTGYQGYVNTAPRTLNETGALFNQGRNLGVNETMKSNSVDITSYLDDYFANRDAAARAAANMSQGG